MRPLPIALLAMGVALLESCNTMCTLIGCADVVEMCAPIVTTAHLRVCRESECSDVTYGPSETYVENDLGPIVPRLHQRRSPERSARRRRLHGHGMGCGRQRGRLLRVDRDVRAVLSERRTLRPRVPSRDADRYDSVTTSSSSARPSRALLPSSPSDTSRTPCRPSAWSCRSCDRTE